MKKRGEIIVITVIARDIIDWGKSRGFEFDFVGDEKCRLTGFSSLAKYKPNSLTWINLKNPVDEELLPTIQCAVLQKGVTTYPQNYFITLESKKFFFAILENLLSNPNKEIAEKENSYIGKDVIVGKNVHIGCNCVLDGEITIGDDTVIEHNVTIMNRVKVGNNCTIHSGTIIGKDGFGYSFDKNNIPQKVPHFGGVQIGDRVEIGCNCSVDRGTIDDTIIEDDVKIDSLVIVAHNTLIKRGVLLVGGVAVGGSCTIGELSYIAPHAVIRNKTEVGKNSFIGMGVTTNQDLGENTFIGHQMDKPRTNKNYRRFI